MPDNTLNVKNCACNAPQKTRQRQPDGNPAPGFSSMQSDELKAFAQSLNPQQLWWASGYFAALANASNGSTPGAEVRANEEQEIVTVLYGSETGNARGVAENIGEALADKGLAATVVDLSSFKPNRLKEATRLIVVTATHGEGSPPEPARSFYEYLMSRKAPMLQGTQYAVLGLGDSSYEYFCQTAKDIDARLESLGAERFQERLECDVDYETPAAEWIGKTVRLLEDDADGKKGNGERANVVLRTDFIQRPDYSPETPFRAPLLDRFVLNGRGSEKRTYHLELSLEDSGLCYAPGDSLGIVTENDPALVEEITTTLGFGVGDRLTNELLYDYELTVLTPQFIKAYGELTEARKLLELGNNTTEMRHYINGRQIVDVLKEYPARGMSEEQFKKMLRKLQPRLYSLASSLTAYPNEAHLTVAEVSYKNALGIRHGVASSYLGTRVPKDETIPVYVEQNDSFRLPDDSTTPIIMIGAGTGIAPYRAFVQERAELGATGDSWLIFGDRHFRTDFLYQIEWQEFLRRGELSRMDVAFSRDGCSKIYVQDRMREQGHDLFRWLEDGANLYVCGDAKRMAPDVHDALIEIVIEHGCKDLDAAKEYVSDLTIDNRYKRDVY